MASSQMKTEHKTSASKKTKYHRQEVIAPKSQKKSAQGFQSQGKRQKKVKSEEQDSPSDAEDWAPFVSGHGGKHEVRRPKEEWGNDFKTENSISKNKDPPNKRNGKQLRYRAEKPGKNVKRMRQDSQNSFQGCGINVKSFEPKDAEHDEKYTIRRKCKRHSRRKGPERESLTVESEEASSWVKLEPRQRRRHGEPRGCYHGRPHSKATGESDRFKKTHAGKQGRIFSEASPVNSEGSSSETPDKYDGHQRRRGKENRKEKIKGGERRNSSSEGGEEWVCSKKGRPTAHEGHFAGNRKSLQGSWEIPSERSRKPEITVHFQEPKDEKSDSERDEKIKGQDERSGAGKATSSDSDKQSGGESSSESCTESPKERESDNESGSEGQENISEKGRGNRDVRNGPGRSKSEGNENEMSSLPKRKQRNEESPLCKTVRSKLLQVGFNRILQEGYQTGENLSDSGEATFSLKPIKHKLHYVPEASRRGSCTEVQTSHRVRSKADSVSLFAKKYSHLTSQSQVLSNLSFKQKDAEIKSQASGNLQSKAEDVCYAQETIQTIHPNTYTIKNDKVAFRAKESKKSRSKLSTISSTHSNTQVCNKKKKKVGKVKTVACQTAKPREEEDVMNKQTTGNATEKDLISKQSSSKSLKTISALRKVTHWLNHKPPKKVSLKDRFLRFARVIGISEWLFRKFAKKKKSNTKFGTRRRMAIRMVSAAGLAKRKSRTSCASTGEPMKKHLDNKDSSGLLLESGQTGEEDEGTVMKEELEEGTRSASIFPCNKVIVQPLLMNASGQPGQEIGDVTDTRFAVVFPRVHQLQKSENTSFGSLDNSGSQLESLHKSRGKENAFTHQDTKLEHELPTFSGQENRSPQAAPSLPTEENMSQGSGLSHTAEEADVDDLSHRTTPETTDQVHWTQHQAPTCDPAAWLSSEILLPPHTIENLSKWTLYKEQDLAKLHRAKKALQGRWEAEDSTEDVLEKDIVQKQIYKGDDFYMQLEKVEDLSRLEEVCESSVLLCLKKRFHLNSVYTYIGHIVIFVNPFRPLGLCSDDVMTQYHKGTLSGNAPHIFAITEMAYSLSQSSEREQCIVISGHSGSGKSEAAKAIVQYFSKEHQNQENLGKKQPSDVLPILESFGNAKTILNDNSSRFGKFLNVHLRHGLMVGTSFSHYLLEKSRVVSQGCGERNFHVFYELLAGLPKGQKERLHLQEAETYFYLNQGRMCELPGKQDGQDFLVLFKALQMIGLSSDELTAIWAVLAGILQLGNICFTSCEKEFFQLAVIPSEIEIQIVANLLRISAGLLQKAITHRLTETCYDRIFTPLSVESAIDARDAIAKALYSLLFEWLMMKINEWMAPSEMDCSVGIVDIYGFEDLGANSLEQLCINFANEHLQQFFTQKLVIQEEEEYTQENLLWRPVSKMTAESCLDVIAAKPYGILYILQEQTLLSQATDHTFLQKCHYHHVNNPWYVKPKLPLPAFTVQHYAGPVTYQVHKFLNKNHDKLCSEILDIFSQSHLKLVSSLFQRLKEQQSNKSESGARSQELKHQTSTLVSSFQQSLYDLTAKLNRSHVFFVRCIKPNSKKVPDIFDTEYVACQLRHFGIFEAICITKEGYPIRIPFHHFLIRYGALSIQGQTCLQERDSCAAVLSHVVGDHSDLYQIGVTKVFLTEKARQKLEKKWHQKLSWAIITLQCNLRGLISRRRFRIFKQKITIIQAHVRGYLARKRYRRLKKTLVQFGVAVIISRPLVHKRKQHQRQRHESLVKGAEENRRCLEMDVRRLEIPADLAALLHLAGEGRHYAQNNQVTEVSPPDVKAKADLYLPPDINDFPFSSFIRSHFQEMGFPALGQPLQQPLTQLDGSQRQSALQLNKLILRFINDKDLHGWQEELVGNYIASQGLSNVPLRNELLSQVASQVWKNPDLEQCQRGWVLMAALLSTFAPSPALDKPLLKYVSDHGLDGYNGMCQRKLLTSVKQMENYLEVSRSFPPTRLEWTTNQRKGKMVLDVYTYGDEKISAEVESWTTGEQYAGWILSSRGLDVVPRGWSVSMFTGKEWQDLAGCDFVLDLIGEIEEGSLAYESSPGYPITPEQEEVYTQLNSSDTRQLMIPPAPGVPAPSFPPPPLPPNFDRAAYSDSDFRSISRSTGGLDHYVDNLFMPLLHHGARSHMSDMEKEESLTGRMKGGGGIGPSQQGVFPGYSGMMNMPAYQTMPAMGGMLPATMPMMPALGGMGTMPVMPTVDPSHIAAQQQAFINQQALLMAQQMTLQAMTISQQQQREKQRERSPETSRPRHASSWRKSRELSRDESPERSSPELSPKSSRARSLQRRSPELSRRSQANSQERSSRPSRARQASSPSQSIPAYKPKNHNYANKDEPVPGSSPPQPIHDFEEKLNSENKVDSVSQKTFQKKIEFFQKMGQETNQNKIIRPSRKWSPPKNLQLENQERNSTELNSEKLQEPEVQNSKPSQEILAIVKTHKNRPVPPPKPIMPLRNVSKPFVKKNDPKEEALAKLGIVGLNHSPVSSEPSEQSHRKTTTTPPPPPSTKLSNTIKEKQLPLMNLFGRPQPTSPRASELPPSPDVPPPPLPAPSYPTEEDRVKGSNRTMLEDAGITTQLFNLSASVSFSYTNPTWKLFLRKEVFYPKENFSNPYCLNLLCEQIMRDTYSETCIRISKEEKRKMKYLLGEFQVGRDASSIPDDGIKKRIVVAARDNWATYFSRLFPVKGENGSDVQILGVSHRGLQLLRRAKPSSFSPEHLKILCSYSYTDVLSLELMGQTILQFSLKSEQFILHSPKARQIQRMVEQFLQKLKQDSNYVIALRSYVTDDKSLLSFKKGDIIRLLPMDGIEPGWQFGSVGGRSGLFPSHMVQPVAAPIYNGLQTNHDEKVKKNLRSKIISNKNSSELESEGTSTTANAPDICHYTMTEFATAHFREAQSTLGLKGMSAEQKNPALLVQHTKVLLETSLLSYSDSGLSDQAAKSFLTLMRFMGDQPRLKNQDEVDCIYEILQLCKEKEMLHDEIYCQVIKQVTQNPDQASCHRGWQLLYLLTGYFLPSSTLMPYATKYLQQASADDTSPYSEIARMCQSNLRKMVLYGGRQHLPFRVEMEALLKGYHSRKISVNLPGGLKYNMKIKTFTVAAEVMQEICEQIGVSEPQETEEFAILANKDSGQVIRPLHKKEYIHDYLLEDSSIALDFCRIAWKTPLHFDNEVYIDIHYTQVLKDYTEGKLLLPRSDQEWQIGTLALLQHWAKGDGVVPSMVELMQYIPKSVGHCIDSESIRDSLAYQLETAKPLEQQEAKIRFIEHVIQLPLFGYNVYPVQRLSIPRTSKDCYVGVNQEQIIIVDGKSQNIHCLIPLKEIHKMQTLRPLDDLPGVEVNYGSPKDPKTVWVELKQAKALYHTITIFLEEFQFS